MQEIPCMQYPSKCTMVEVWVPWVLYSASNAPDPLARPLGGDDEYRFLLGQNTCHAFPPTQNASTFFFFYSRPVKQKFYQKWLRGKKTKKDKSSLYRACFLSAWIHREKHKPFDIFFNKHKVEKKMAFI